MNSDHSQRDDSPISDEQLDRLLASADLPAQSPKRNRAMRRWLDSLLQQTRPTPHAGFRFALAFAATIILALGVWAILSNRTDRPALVKDTPTPKIESAVIPSGVPSRRRKFKRRPRSPYLTNKIRRTTADIASSDLGVACLESLSMSLDHAASNAQRTRNKKAWKQLRPLLRWRDNVEYQLASKVNQFQAEHTTATVSHRQRVRLLCCVASSRSLDVIQPYLNDPECQPNVIRAVSRVGDSHLLGRLAQHSQYVSVQAEFLGRLLDRGDRQSLDIYLKVTGKLDSFEVVQASADAAHSLPVDLLLEALGSNRIRTTRVAATLLASHDDPAVSKALQQLAFQPKTSRAAIFALAARSDEAAIYFLRRASNDLRYRAIVQNETRNWDRLLKSRFDPSVHFSKPHSNP